MKTLVTGGDGLLGAELIARLLDLGEDVRVITQPGSVSPILDGLEVEQFEADLTADRGRIFEAFKGVDTAFHCAAITSPYASKELTFKVNYDGALAVLDACVDAGVKKLVAVGSASSFEFGPIDKPGDETGALPAVYVGAPYMESKRAATMKTVEYAKEGKLDALIVAPTFLLGRHDWRPSSGELIVKFVKKGISSLPRGGRNFASAADVAAGMITARKKGKAGEIYIAGGNNADYLDFFTQVAELAGVAPPKRSLPDAAILAAGAVAGLAGKLSGGAVDFDLKIARMSIVSAYYSSEKAKKELGYKVSPFRETIAATIEGLKQYGHI